MAVAVPKVIYQLMNYDPSIHFHFYQKNQTKDVDFPNQICDRATSSLIVIPGKNE
jgi:hypothetical protein